MNIENCFLLENDNENTKIPPHCLDCKNRNTLRCPKLPDSRREEINEEMDIAFFSYIHQT